MRRRENIEICLNRIINKCDDRELYKLLFELQDVSIMYGYATATLTEFENGIYKNCNDKEISRMIKSGESDRLFEKWINESL